MQSLLLDIMQSHCMHVLGQSKVCDTASNLPCPVWGGRHIIVVHMLPVTDASCTILALLLQCCSS